MTVSEQPVVPDVAWLTVEDVERVLGAGTYAGVDAEALSEHLAAARAYVEGRRPDLYDQETGDYVPTPDVRVGTAMLAYRWFTRRTSPLGVQVTGFESEAGGGEILRHDPDIELLLGTGRAGGFVFGGARR